MRRQFLGDSKDAFKWDYLHFATAALGARNLSIGLMLTPDKQTTHGSSPPDRYPAIPEIIELCLELRRTRDHAVISSMPSRLGMSYEVGVHPESLLALIAKMRSRVAVPSGEIFFLDPDNGFEPERSAGAEHVRFGELDALLDSLAPDSVVIVYQHHRRRRFAEDFARIRERLISGASCAIHAGDLMFVSISRSTKTIAGINAINADYAEARGLTVLN